MPSPTEIQSMLERRTALRGEAAFGTRETLDAALANPATTVELAVTVRNPHSPPARIFIVSTDREAVAALVKDHRTSAEQRMHELDADLRKHGISDEPAPTARRATAQPHSAT